MVRVAVGRLLLTLTCVRPFFDVLRTTKSARPFQVVTCGEVVGSLSFRSALAKAIKCPCPFTAASHEMAASGHMRPFSVYHLHGHECQVLSVGRYHIAVSLQP